MLKSQSSVHLSIYTLIHLSCCSREEASDAKLTEAMKADICVLLLTHGLEIHNILLKSKLSTRISIDIT